MLAALKFSFWCKKLPILRPKKEMFFFIVFSKYSTNSTNENEIRNIQKRGLKLFFKYSTFLKRPKMNLNDDEKVFLFIACLAVILSTIAIILVNVTP